MLMGVVSLFGVLAVQAAVSLTDEPRVTPEPRVGAAPRSDLRVDSNLVLIPVSVTDPKNRPLTGLVSDQFRVFEGKSEQKVLHLSSDDAPLSVGIVFDASGSMAAKLGKAREAVAEFLKSANSSDEFFLVNFSSTARLAVPFSDNPAEIRTPLMLADSKGRTALRNQNILAYSPANIEADGKYRRVEVKRVERRDLHVSWRPGYYAPGR